MFLKNLKFRLFTTRPIHILGYSFGVGPQYPIIPAQITLINSQNSIHVGFSCLSWNIIDRDIFFLFFMNKSWNIA